MTNHTYSPSADDHTYIPVAGDDGYCSICGRLGSHPCHQPVPAPDLDELPDLIERLNAWRQWEKTGHNHDLLAEAIAVVEALRERASDNEIS